ncbi:MAG: nucleotidyltransferase family protein [Flavobacteriales bacterium]
MFPLIEQKKDDIRSLCQALRVKKLYAFGSAVTGDFSTNSDIDFLLSFADDLSVEEYTENYFTLHSKLRELFQRNIDLITERSLSNPYFIDSIIRTRQLVYEA